MNANEFAATRRAAGLSQHCLAKRAGTTQDAVCRYERGYTDLRPDQVEKLKGALREELTLMARKAEHLLETLSA